MGLCSDFGPLTRQAVEQLAGTAAGWPASVYRIQAGKAEPGPAFRCFPHQPGQGNPQVYGADAVLRASFPGRVLLDYTGSWYPLYDQVGANWASPRYLPQEYGLARPEQYQQAGYAPLVDNLLSGCYYPKSQSGRHRTNPPTGTAWRAPPVGPAGGHGRHAGDGRPLSGPVPRRACQHCTGSSDVFCPDRPLHAVRSELSGRRMAGGDMHSGSTALQPLTGAELPALHALLQRALPQSYDLGRERLERAAFHDHAILQTATLCLKRWDGSLLGAVVSKRFEPGASPYGAPDVSACWWSILPSRNRDGAAACTGRLNRPWVNWASAKSSWGRMYATCFRGAGTTAGEACIL